MDIDHPSVTVCLPVFNGAKYLTYAIESVLGQSFADFELVISDNASSDDTSDICHDYAMKDKRVRYCRNDINRGLAWNLNRTFWLGRAAYVMWMGHDDVMLPEYLERCVAGIESDPQAVLSYASADYINELGNVVEREGPTNPGASPSPSERFATILYDQMCDPIFGVIRRSALLQTKLHGAYADSDRVLLADLGLRGRFHFIPQPLFLRRVHADQTTTRYRDRSERTIVFDPSRAGKAVFPWTKELLGLVNAAKSAPLSWRERYLTCKNVYWWFGIHRAHIHGELCRGLASLFWAQSVQRPSLSETNNA